MPIKMLKNELTDSFNVDFLDINTIQVPNYFVQFTPKHKYAFNNFFLMI